MNATTRHTGSGRERWTLRLIIAAAAAAVIATVLAVGNPARGADPSQPSEFTLTLKDNVQRIVDNPPRGENPTIGDSAAFNKILLDASAKRVGSIQAHGTITAAGKDPTETIEGVAILAGGRLMLQESFKFSDPVHHIAITGGTGKYEGATGTATSGLKGQGENDLLFRVRVP